MHNDNKISKSDEKVHNWHILAQNQNLILYMDTAPITSSLRSLKKIDPGLLRNHIWWMHRQMDKHASLIPLLWELVGDDQCIKLPYSLWLLTHFHSLNYPSITHTCICVWLYRYEARDLTILTQVAWVRIPHPQTDMLRQKLLFYWKYYWIKQCQAVSLESWGHQHSNGMHVIVISGILRYLWTIYHNDPHTIRMLKTSLSNDVSHSSGVHHVLSPQQPI